MGVCKVAKPMEADPATGHVERATEELHWATKLLDRAIAKLQGSAPDGPTDDVLKTMYQEVCRHHQSISEFRGKLLGLVPIASGAFIGLITAKVDWSTSGPLLIAAGAVGALVTFGLYLYEAWQSDTCRHLIHHATFLEKELHMEAGQFRTLRQKTRVRELYPAYRVDVYEWREQYWSQVEQDGIPPERYRQHLKKLKQALENNKQNRALHEQYQERHRQYLRKLDQDLEQNEAFRDIKDPSGELSRLRWRVGAELAGFVVYGAVFVAWLVVAGFGVAALFVS
jgi:hypothetical protein